MGWRAWAEEYLAVPKDHENHAKEQTTSRRIMCRWKSNTKAKLQNSRVGRTSYVVTVKALVEKRKQSQSSAPRVRVEVRSPTTFLSVDGTEVILQAQSRAYDLSDRALSLKKLYCAACVKVQARFSKTRIDARNAKAIALWKHVKYWSSTSREVQGGLHFFIQSW